MFYIWLYLSYSFILFIVGTIIYFIDKSARIDKYPIYPFDRLWWRLTKQTIWWFLFWPADLPWILNISRLRFLFIKKSTNKET